MDLLTVKATRSAIRTGCAVYIQARFGCSEDWLKISKAEALKLLSTLDVDATPHSFEMYAGVFGTQTGGARGEVWLG